MRGCSESWEIDLPCPNRMGETDCKDESICKECDCKMDALKMTRHLQGRQAAAIKARWFEEWEFKRRLGISGIPLSERWRRLWLPEGETGEAEE